MIYVITTNKEEGSSISAGAGKPLDRAIKLMTAKARSEPIGMRYCHPKPPAADAPRAATSAMMEMISKVRRSLVRDRSAVWRKSLADPESICSDKAVFGSLNFMLDSA